MKKIITLLFLLMAVTTLSAQEKETRVLFKTNRGDFTIKLYNETPIHRDNFVKLVKEGAYNNLTFHRVIRNFMVQAGGGMKDDNIRGYEAREGRYHEMLPAEIHYPQLYHKRGALAAARIGNERNPEKKSSPIQFYIVIGQFYLESELEAFPQPDGTPMPEEIKQAYMTIGGTPHLDNEYTVFGELVEGWKTIEKIEREETDGEDKPLKEIYIKSATILD